MEYHSKEEDAEHGKRRLKVCDSLPSPPSLPFLPTLSHAMQAMKMMKNDKRFRVPLIDGLIKSNTVSSDAISVISGKNSNSLVIKH